MLHIDNIVLHTHYRLLRPAVLTIHYVNTRNGRRSYVKTTNGGDFRLHSSEILQRPFSQIVQAWSIRCFM